MIFENLHKPKNRLQRPTSSVIYVVDGEEQIFCPLRKKVYKIDGKPEELVRQWWIYRLKDTYGYSFDQELSRSAP